MKSEKLYNYGEVSFANEELISLYVYYLDVLTNTWSRQWQNVVTFSESHDFYYGLGYTRDKTSKEITQDYACVVQTYPKTIYFARLFDNEWKSKDIRDIHQKIKKIRSFWIKKLLLFHKKSERSFLCLNIKWKLVVLILVIF